MKRLLHRRQRGFMSFGKSLIVMMAAWAALIIAVYLIGLFFRWWR